MKFYYYLLSFVLIFNVNYGYSQGCPGNLLSNGSLENGTFSSFTTADPQITGTLTTLGGSQAVYLSAASSGNTIPDMPINGYMANLGYWIDASTNGGLGSQDLNRLFHIPQATGASRCLFPNSGMGFSYTTNNCYKVKFYAAQFNVNSPNNPALVDNFVFEWGDAWGSADAGNVSNFSYTPVSVSDAGTWNVVEFQLPASTNVKTITGVPYTGAVGQVVDWKTLNWQLITFDFTPLLPSNRLTTYISTINTNNNGICIDNICITPNCGVLNSCSISLTSSSSLCLGGQTNTYTLNGQATFTDPPSTGVLTIGVPGGNSVIFNAPFVSPITYSLPKMYADGASHSVSASFSASACSTSVTYTAPSPVGMGGVNFPLNSTLADAYYGLNPHRSAYVDDFHYPGYATTSGLTGEAFDLDLLPSGVTNLAGFCIELEEGFGGTTHYYNKYSIIPLENISRGRAGQAGTTSLNIPTGGIGKVRAGMVRYLFDNYYISTDVSVWTNNQAAAFQFALWEITHEVYSGNNSFSISTPSVNGFYTTSTFSPAIVSLSNSYLNSINSLNWSNEQWSSYQSQNFHVVAAENNPEDYQDFIFAQPIICASSCTPPIAGANQSICITSGSVTLTGSSPSTGTWSAQTGNPSGASIGTTSGGLATVTFTNATPGTYNFIYNIGTSCEDTLSVVVGTPPTADAGSIQNLNCTTTSTTIGTTAIGGNTYSWNPSTGLSAANIAQPTANPTATTTYTVTVTGSNGCTATASVTVNVNTAAPTANAGSTQNLDCTTTSATIGTTAIAGNTYSWSPSTGLSATNIAQPTATPTATTTYTVTVTSSNGCTATASVTVNVNTTAPTADAGSSQNLDCTTTSATIGTTAIVGNTYSWSPATGLSATNIAQPTASPTATTTYTVTVTGSNGCTATASVTVNVNTTAPTADAGSTQNLDCTTTSATIGTTAIAGNTYSWSPSTGLSATNIAQPTATPTATTTYTVTVTSSNGCTATASVTVNVNASLGTIGNYVWNDMNNNGLNDENTNAGLNAVTVELWKETSPSSGVYSLSQTTSTDYNAGNPGYYSFTVCENANYKVKFPIANNAGSPLTQQTTTAATDNNSDANLVDGFSPVFAIDINGTGSDKDNMTIDAGYYVEPACLGNYVWNDINKDGIQNNGEVGVAGISVSLLDNGLNSIGSTITDAYGFYQFCSLVPGTYSVIFTLPSNYTFTSQNATTDEVDSDVDPITGITTSYVLAAGDSNMTADAGIYFEQPITASVGNYVWLDVNQNGIQDNNEQGISGVTVTLYNSAGDAVATMPTNANGFYLFTNVTPGNYSVGFTAPVGLSFTVQNGATNNASNSDADPSTGVTVPFTVNAGDEITYVDAGLFSLPQNVGSLGNRVWYDEDQDGVQDATETGVNNVIVTLYQQDGTTILNETVTDAYGNYIFNNLPQGGYVVGFSNLPLNYVFTTTSGTDSATNSDANIISGKTAIIYLAQGQHNMTYDAGIYTTQSANTNSVGNFVWDDLNKDGIQTNNEPGVAGVTVTLYNNTNAAIATTSTDANGLYLFPNLPNGTYYVGFSNLPLNYVFSIMGQGTSATDNDADPSTGKTATTTLTGNTHDMTLDAGINFGSTRLGLGTLGDLVWYDMNNNGLQDNDELGVQGVTVTLYESNGTTVISTTTTNALGNYIFTGLEEGAYVVGFDNLPSGFSLSPKNADNQGINGEANSDVNSGTNKTDLINLGDGEDKMSVDMGITPPAGTAGLGNYVWMDLNNDGLQTSGEPGVQGIGVTLYDNTNTAIATTTTDANGAYSFVGLTPGTYSVGFDNLPSGFGFTTENSDAQGINGSSNSDANASTGMTSTVTLAAGDYNPNLDAGIVSTTVASVGDYVWYDMNQDGLQDANEPGIGGILVSLYNSSNTAVASTITRPDGSYIFTNVTPGDYTMGFSNIPSGMEFTQEVGTATDNNNSNVTPSIGLTATFTVIAGTHNPTIDAGLTTPINAGLGNYVWFDVDKDGVQDSNEPGIAGAIVTLYAQDGTTVLGTAITDGNGAYTFTNLPAGQYSICVGNVPYIFHSTGNRMVAVPTVQNAAVGTDETDSDINPLGGCTINYTLAAGEYNPSLDAGFVYQFAVPVVMKDFTVLNDQCNVFVNWVTSSEKNTSHYNVMRTSTTNNTTTKVAQIMAKGNTQSEASYSYTDRDVATGTYTYHLEIVDIDGQQSLSDKKSVQVNCQTNTDKVSVYPNPTTGQLNIRIVSEQNDEYTINVRDAVGRLVMQSTMEVNNTTKNMVMNLGGLAAGTYSVEVLGYYQTQTFKIQLSK